MESVSIKDWNERFEELKRRTEHCRNVAIQLRKVLEPLQREIEKYKLATSLIKSQASHPHERIEK